jgi:hypothetical protein
MTSGVNINERGCKMVQCDELCCYWICLNFGRYFISRVDILDATTRISSLFSEFVMANKLFD